MKSRNQTNEIKDVKTGKVRLRPNAILADKKTARITVQTPFPLLRCLVLEGGGMKGAAYAGALKVLEKYGLLKDIEFIAGSSAGAIAALIIGLGYEVEEANKILSDLPVDSFLESGKAWSITPDFFTKGKQIFSVLANKNHSLSSGKKFLEWIKKLVANKLGNENATFRDLNNKIEKDKQLGINTRFKNLYITGTNLSLTIPECEVFSLENTPDMPLAIAILISSTFPFVFEPVEWNGHKYVDGGLKNNTPGSIFDKRKFLPPGYDFTERGKNPGTVIIKIDSIPEIAQLIWGIKKDISLEKATDIAAAIFNSLIETADAEEIRESRFVIALPDGNIQTLQSTLDDTGKINLISSAQKATIEFLRNYIGSAYKVQSYKDIVTWLDDQSLDEIDDIKLMYEEKRDQTIEEKKPRFNEYIEFLDHYFLYRRAFKRNPSIKIDFKIPDKHIDIMPIKQDQGWINNIKTDMENRLETAKFQIKIVTKKLCNDFDQFITSCKNKNTGKLHEEPFFQQIKQITGFYEYRNFLLKEKNELEITLDKHEKSLSNDVKENSMRYEILCNKIETYLKENNLPSFLAITKCIDMYRQEVIFKSTNENDDILFMLDLSKQNDCKLFLLTSFMYLQHKGRVNEVVLLGDLYAAIFGIEINVLQNIKELSILLDLQGVELYMSIYIMEELLHYFEKLEIPDVNPILDIDCLLGMSKSSIFTIKEKEKSNNHFEVELKNIFHGPAIIPSYLSLFKPDKHDINNNNTHSEKYAVAQTVPSWFFGGIAK